MKRSVNSEVLKNYMEKQGQDGVVSTSKDSGISFSWLQKAANGAYTFTPRRLTREALCRVTGISEDVLFPIVTSNRKRAS